MSKHEHEFDLLVQEAMGKLEVTYGYWARVFGIGIVAATILFLWEAF